MKRLLSILAVLWVATATAEDSWLYWMVGDTGGYSSSAYDTVRVKGNLEGGGSEYLNLYWDSSTVVGDSVARSTVLEANDYGAGLYAKLASDTSYSSFVIELWNDSLDPDKFIAKSTSLSMASAAAYIESANSMSLSSAWVGSAYAIPEPNSAMLLLIGCSVLALRRRRRSA